MAAPTNTPAAVDQPGRLHCYACGHDYDYLGSDPHPGRCPSCGSPCVPPAGHLRAASGPEPVDSNAATHRIDAVDETGRRFCYWLSALPNDRAQLVAVDAAGTPVGPAGDRWPEHLPQLVPDWLGTALDAVGLTLVAPATVVE